jgi:meiotic recombination protein SPO11
MIQSIPFLALVDHDPHGLEILATYKFGSAAQAMQCDYLALTDLKWLGVHATDMASGMAKVLPFTAGDSRKLKCLMNKDWLSMTNSAGTWRDELTQMQKGGVKAEIEVLDEQKGGLLRCVENKIRNCQWL